MADIEHNETAHNHTIIHIKDLVREQAQIQGQPTTTAPPSLDKWDKEEEEEEVWEQEGKSSQELRPTEPIVLYLWREHTAPKRKVLKVLPSLSALKNNEVCDIVTGNEEGLFQMSENKGMSSLQYSMRLEKKAVHKLTLRCRPVHDEGKVIGDTVKLEAFDIVLQLHIL